MKKLLLIFTFLLVFPLKAFASCEDFTTNNATFGQTIVSYVNDDNVSLDVTSSNTSYVTLTRPKRIGTIQKRFTATMSGDYVYFSGTFFIDTPDVSMLPAPYLYPVNASSSQSLCNYRYITTGTDSIPTYHVYDSSDGSFIGSNKLSIYSFSLECPISDSWSDTSTNYTLLWQTSYGAVNSYEPYGSDIESFTSLSLSLSFRATLVYSSNICSDEQISNLLENIDDSITDISDSLTDLNDSITDTTISNSVSELESQLEDWGVNYHGVAGFVTAPLSFISSLANQQACNPIPLPPILGNTSSTFVLPCFMEEFEDRFPSLFAIYEIAIYFFVCYRIGIDCFKLIQKLKDPLNDEISVADI